MTWIESELCIGCGRCVEACEVEGAIFLVDDKSIIDPSKCVSCGRCAEICPRGAVRTSASAAEPEGIRRVEVYPEVPAVQEDMLPRAASQTVEAAERVPSPPNAQRWMTVASTALGAAATLGETLLARWLEGRRGGTGGRSRVGGGPGRRRQHGKGPARR